MVDYSIGRLISSVGRTDGVLPAFFIPFELRFNSLFLSPRSLCFTLSLRSGEL